MCDRISIACTLSRIYILQPILQVKYYDMVKANIENRKIIVSTQLLLLGEHCKHILECLSQLRKIHFLMNVAAKRMMKKKRTRKRRIRAAKRYSNISIFDFLLLVLCKCLKTLAQFSLALFCCGEHFTSSLLLFPCFSVTETSMTLLHYIRTVPPAEKIFLYIDSLCTWALNTLPFVLCAVNFATFANRWKSPTANKANPQ